MASRVLDISRYQLTFDAAQAKRQGIEGVMMRAGYGLGQDTCFLNFARNAHDAGLAAGSYLFATWHYHSVSPTFEDAKKNACKQAKSYINILRQAPVNSFAALDLELEAGQKCLLNKHELSECANLFMKTLAQNGYRPLLYCSCSWLLEEKIDEQAIHYPFWVACYHSIDADFSFQPADHFPSSPYGQKLSALGDRLAMWQFGSVGGGTTYGCGSVNVDKNWAYAPLITRGGFSALLKPLQKLLSFFQKS